MSDFPPQPPPPNIQLQYVDPAGIVQTINTNGNYLSFHAGGVVYNDGHGSFIFQPYHTVLRAIYDQPIVMGP